QPVSLVRGHAARARVRLHDEALLFEHRHVIADGRRGDVQAVPVDEGLRADRLVGRHVVLDDGAQHRQLPVVEHAHLPGTPISRVPSLWREGYWDSARSSQPSSKQSPALPSVIARKGDVRGLMTIDPSQPAPERPAPGPASSEPLDALPARADGPGPAEQRPPARRPAGEPESRPAGPARWPAARAPWPAPVAGQPAAAERGTGEQARVIARERAEPAAPPAAPAGPPDPQPDDHRLAMLSYLGVPFLGPVIPLVIYLIRKQ